MIKDIPELKQISDAFKSLKKKGVIRSNNLVGDLGEYYCQEKLEITLSENKVQKGYDGIDEEEKKVQIKTRRKPKGSASVYFKNLEFDYCLFVELNENYEPIEILKISKEEIDNNLNIDKKRLSVSKIKNHTKNIKLL